MMTDMGASGAHVDVHSDHAVKWALAGSDAAFRVDQQAAWLQEHVAGFLPHVEKVMPGGYRMELLVALPDFVDDEVLARLLLTKLGKLWEQPSDHGFDAGLHLAYVRERALRVGCEREMKEWAMRSMHTISTCDTVTVHGDPTIDNCMLRGGGELVITDPIPPGIHLPSVRALDIGKVIQSAMGYEEVALGRRPTTIPWIDSAFWEEALPDVDGDEWNLCLYMAAVHFLRLMPYTPQHADEWSERVRQLVEWGE